MKRKISGSAESRPLLPTACRAEPQPDFAAINTYRTCPLRYYFQYVAKLAEKSISASLVFGAAIHRAIEHHFKRLNSSDAKATLDGLMVHYQDEWRRHDTVPVEYGADQRAALDLLASRMLGVFLRDPLAQFSGRIIAVGGDLQRFGRELPPLAGRVDLIGETDDRMVLQSWKTSRLKWTEEQVTEEASRLALCAERLVEFARGKPIDLEILVLTKTKDLAIERHARPFCRQLLERGKRTFERVGQGIDAGLFYPAPSPIACSTCSFRDPCCTWSG